MLSTILHALTAYVVAHPFIAASVGYVIVSGINGLLPANVRGGPVGIAFNIALDRISALTRRNAAGTLKWPIITASILRVVADSLNPPEATVLPRATVAPPEPIEPRPFDPAAHITRAELPPIDGQR